MLNNSQQPCAFAEHGCTLQLLFGCEFVLFALVARLPPIERARSRAIKKTGSRKSHRRQEIIPHVPAHFEQWLEQVLWREYLSVATAWTSALCVLRRRIRSCRAARILSCLNSHHGHHWLNDPHRFLFFECVIGGPNPYLLLRATVKLGQRRLHCTLEWAWRDERCCWGRDVLRLLAVHTFDRDVGENE